MTGGVGHIIIRLEVIGSSIRIIGVCVGYQQIADVVVTFMNTR